MRYLFFLILMLSIACVYQAEDKETKEVQKSSEVETIIMSTYGYDLTKGRIIDTTFAFTKITDSALIKEHRSTQDLEYELSILTIFRHTIDSILHYDYTCKLVKKDKIYTTTDSIDVLIYKYPYEDDGVFIFLDKNQNMLSSHELHYRTTVLFYPPSMKEKDKQLLVKQIKEICRHIWF